MKPQQSNRDSRRHRSVRLGRWQFMVTLSKLVYPTTPDRWVLRTTFVCDRKAA